MSLFTAETKNDVLKYITFTNVDDLLKGKTALMYASEKGNYDVVKELIKCNADINFKTLSSNKTALMFACMKGFINIIDILLENNADINVLQACAPIGSVSSIKDPMMYAFNKILINNKSALSIACRYQHFDAVKHLLQTNKITVLEEKEGGYDSTPLLIACYEGDLNIVNLLVNYGANVHARNDTGSTCLYLACYSGHFDIAKRMIECGVDINATNKHIGTPLHTAYHNDRIDIIKLLLDNGADTTIINNQGKLAINMKQTENNFGSNDYSYSGSDSSDSDNSE